MAQAKTAREWISKRDAANFLGITDRSLERRAAAGFIRTRREERLPHEKAARALYSFEDLKAIQEGRPNNHPTISRPLDQIKQGLTPSPGRENAAPMPVETALAKIPPSASVEYFARVLESLSLVKAAPVKPWLTLEEAAEYSGLPAAWLRAHAPDGFGGAINIGSGSRVFWRFRRDLL